MRLCRDLLQHGRRFRQEEREAVWKRSEEQYAGEHWKRMEVSDPTADLITVNLSFSTVNTIVPYITGEEPHFIVEPYSGDASPRNARIQAAILNRLWRSSDTEGQEKLEDVAVDFLIYGDGYLQVGHTIEERRIADGEYEDVASLFIDRIDPWDLWIDPTSDGIHNARWVCRRIVTTLEELEADERYTVPEHFSPTLGQEFFTEDDKLRERLYLQGEEGNQLRWVSLFEFYNVVGDYCITFTEGADLPLRWIDGPAIPIVQFANYRIPRNPYHMGELEQLWELQQEINESRSQMITHRRRNVQKFAYLRNVLDEEAVEALTSTVVNAAVPVDGDQDIDTMVKALAAPNLSADVYNVSDLITRDVYEISGVNEYLRGATPEVRRTATEATIIEGASNVKSRYKLRLIEKSVRRVGQLMLDTIRETYPQTEADELSMYLTGNDAQAITRMMHGEQVGQMVSAGASPDEIATYSQANAPEVFGDVVVQPTDQLFAGRYEVFVESHSTELRSPVIREQRAREMFLALAQTAPLLTQMGIPINLRSLLERWLEAAGIEDIEAVFDPAGMAPPMAPQLGQPQGQGAPTQQGAGPGADPTNILAAMGLLGADNTGANQPAA